MSKTTFTVVPGKQEAILTSILDAAPGMESIASGSIERLDSLLARQSWL